MNRRILAAVPLVILALVLGLRVADPVPVEQVRWLTFDAYQRLNPRTYDPGLPVRIVDIDDASLARLGQWPWPRTLMARLVERLAQMGAAAIAFDIAFAEPDRSSPERVLSSWPALPGLEDLRRRLAELPAHDRIFADAIAGAPVVTGFILTHRPGGRAPAVTGTFVHAGDDPRPFVPGFAGAVASLAELEAAAAGNGALNSSPERDQVIRAVPLVFRLGEALYPSLAAEALRVAQGAESYLVKSSGASGATAFGASTGLNLVRIGPGVVPTDAHGRLFLRYRRAAPESYIPAWRVLEPEFDPQEVAGRIVFVGASAPGLFDLRATPLERAVPGVEVHAQAVEQILTGDFLRRPDFATGAELAYMLLLGLGLIWLLARIGAVGSLAVGLAVTAGVVAGSWLAYDRLGWLVDPVYPSFTILFVFLSATIVSYLRTEAEKRQVRHAFSHYLAPALVERLAGNPAQLKLGGEIRTMTVMFADIRGFTGLSERFKDDPEGLTALINRFLTPMTEAVLAHGGTVDKYIGDCLMAFWNAPLDDARHAEHACRAALAMARSLDELNRELAAQAAAEGRERPLRLEMGVGLSTGRCVVGNMGSKQRFDYSVLGDSVNLASRLEGQSKLYGVGIIAGEETRRLAPDLAAVELDLIAVKGRLEATRIHALLGGPELAAQPDFQAFESCHRRMLAAYRGQRWGEARALLEQCAAQAGPALRLDGLYGLYAARIARFEREPPPAGWQGVFVAETK